MCPADSSLIGVAKAALSWETDPNAVSFGNRSPGLPAMYGDWRWAYVMGNRPFSGNAIGALNEFNDTVQRRVETALQ
jgi:hypothetical protein